MWYKEVERYLANKLDTGMPVVIVANKKDMLEKTKETKSNYVDIQVAREKAHKEGLSCIETSAKTGENISKLFTMVARSLSGSQSPHSISNDTVDLLNDSDRSKCSC